MNLPFVDLGRMPYRAAYEEQSRRLAGVLEARERGEPCAGVLLLVEHDPVVTISHRKSAPSNLLATPEMLALHGVDVQETDRGGDITYHGPGQLVAYPILDLQVLRLGLHDYMRMLEDVVIAVCARFGLAAERDPSATGVWVPRREKPAAKICAMGVRVRKWATMHGLALNVTTNLGHFDLIVPCGLAGRPVTSLEAELGAACPTMVETKKALAEELSSRVGLCSAG